MRRAIAWLLAGLPFDARSRRAIDETLLDWEGEATEARTFWEATEAELRGVAAVLRVAALSTARESLDFGWLFGLWRRFAVAALTIVGLAVGLSVYVAGEFASMMLMWFVPLLAMVGISPTLFLAIAWRPTRQSVPSLGACWLVAVTAVVVIQALTVLAGELYYSLLYRDLEITRPAAIRSTWLQPGFLVAMLAWGSFVGSVAAAAASLARRSGLQSRWWLVAVPLVSLLVPVGVQSVVRLTLTSAGLPVQYRLYSDVVVFATMVGALLLLAAKFGQAKAAPESETVS